MTSENRSSQAPFFSAAGWRELAGGRRRGPAAMLARGALRVVECGYAAAMRLRNRRYDSGSAPAERVGVPVVSIGNLTLGGTGKTPLVEWVARRLRARDLRVAIVSRGYGAGENSRNDEALELEQKLPDVPHLQDPDRVAGARTAIEEFESQVILLDDGFQHRRLARDLDIVLLDALEPFGYGHVFPRGMLREPPAGLRRAGAIGLSRADLVDPSVRRAVRDVVRTHNPSAAWFEVRHAPVGLLNSAGDTAPLDWLRDRRLLGFCGLGNPQGFSRTLAGLGARLVDWQEFPDHHDYGRADIEALSARAAAGGAEGLICTQKDLVKIRMDQLRGLPVWAVVVGIEFLAGEAELSTLLERHVPAAGC